MQLLRPWARRDAEVVAQARAELVADTQHLGRVSLVGERFDERLTPDKPLLVY
jgi:hypothetical protein